MQRKSRTIETYLNDKTLQDMVVSFLYATTMVADNEEVTNLTIGMPDAKGIRPITFTFIKEAGVQVIVHK